MIEWKNFPLHGNSKNTILTYEEPCDYKDNYMERYYPVKDLEGENRNLYNKYSRIKNKKTTFIGRCGMYVYIDMHQAVSSSMATANKFLKKIKIFKFLSKIHLYFGSHTFRSLLSYLSNVSFFLDVFRNFQKISLHKF